MATAASNRVDWKLLWAQRSFRYFFTAMFVSLFGSGMNFIAVMQPGFVVPFLGGTVSRHFMGRTQPEFRPPSLPAAAILAVSSV
jgi:hypothetical protein